jgi:hypothetical protein
VAWWSARSASREPLRLRPVALASKAVAGDDGIWASIRKTINRRVEGVDRTVPPTLYFTGGMRSPWFTASWPLARLSVFPWGVHMDGSASWLRTALPVWEARFDELTKIEPGRGRLGSYVAVRFKTRSAADWAIFWAPRNAGRVLDEIERLGVTVSRDVVTIYMTDGGR